MGNRLSIARPGTGDKPKKIKRSATSDVAIYIPRDLNAEERLVWRRWAPRAVAKRTLTAQTVGGFRFLVECEVLRRRMETRIDTDGIQIKRMYIGLDGQERIESVTPHPLLPAYAKQLKQVEVLLARFGLLPFGKAEPDLPSATVANPWANLGKG
jgi:hypothetical protein